MSRGKDSVITEDWTVMCPYYLSETPVTLKCKGVVGDVTTNWFANKLEKKEHKSSFCCCNFYHGCPLAITLDELVVDP